MNRVVLSLVFLFISHSSLAEENDFELAKTALGVIGADVAGSSKKCSSCHGLSSGLLKKWGQASVRTEGCLSQWSEASGEKEALKILDCLGYRADKRPELSPGDIGLSAARLSDSRWPEIFKAAFVDGERKFKLLKSRVGMPMGGGAGFSDSDWATVTSWIHKGMPYLELLVGSEDAPSMSCEPFVSKDLKQYLVRRQNMSWQTKNREANMLNWSCASNDEAETCFKQSRRGVDTFPLVGSMSASRNWHIRKITDLGRQTSFWMRVSPDGRFVASGVSDGIYEGGTAYNAAVFDLAPMLTSNKSVREIPVAAHFDPSFFPDQSGFVFQSPNMICPTSLLKRPDTQFIHLGSPGCASGDMAFYHSVGSGLEGGRYLAFSGQFAADDGEGDGDEGAEPWPKRSEFSFELFQFDGQSFVSKAKVPFEVHGMGDAILSPSTEVLLSRVIGQEGQVGYRLDKVSWEGQNNIRLTPEGMICTQGAKGNFSFDERFVTFHKYDKKGASDIFVTDLLENKTYQVTKMKAGVRALYPNFRSDGWLYFFVKSKTEANSEVYVSDVVLRLTNKKEK